MAIVDPRTWMEVLPELECWRLLRLSPVARLATVVDGAPMIWPLNVAVDDRTVVFRTDHGSKLAGLQDRSIVAVEVDGIDMDERRGWSIVAVGEVHELAAAALTRARQLPLAPWTVGDKPRWFGVGITHISGRAIGDRAARPER